MASNDYSYLLNLIPCHYTAHSPDVVGSDLFTRIIDSLNEPPHQHVARNGFQPHRHVVRNGFQPHTLLCSTDQQIRERIRENVTLYGNAVFDALVARGYNVLLETRTESGPCICRCGECIGMHCTHLDDSNNHVRGAVFVEFSIFATNPTVLVENCNKPHNQLSDRFDLSLRGCDQTVDSVIDNPNANQIVSIRSADQILISERLHLQREAVEPSCECYAGRNCPN
jgi:hypothetical protein